jgi:hypothetical protein
MRDLIELCAKHFEEEVAEIFAAYEEFSGSFALTPYLRDLYQPHCKPTIPDLVRQVCRARVASAWFAHLRHPLVHPLPLSTAEFEELTGDEQPHHLNLVGHFAWSLRWCDWDFITHPTFEDFAAGVLAHPNAPCELKKDPELLAQFPPCPLAGLDKDLFWSSPAMIAKEKKERARVRQLWIRDGVPMAEVIEEFGY